MTGALFEHKRGQPVVVILLVAGCLLAPLSLSVLWLRSQVLDTGAYVSTVMPLSSNPAVDQVVANRVVDALVSSIEAAGVPVGPGDRSSVRAAVGQFLVTPDFRRLWQVANTQAHEELLAVLNGDPSPYLAPDGSVVLDLGAIIAQVQRDLAAGGRHQFDQIRPGPAQGRIVVARRSALDRVRLAVRLLRALAFVLPLASIACFLVALVVSRRRRRTVPGAGIGLAVAFGLAVAGVIALRVVFVHAVVGPDIPRSAAVAVYDVVIRNLRTELELACLAGVALAGAGVLGARLLGRQAAGS